MRPPRLPNRGAQSTNWDGEEGTLSAGCPPDPVNGPYAPHSVEPACPCNKPPPAPRVGLSDSVVVRQRLRAVGGSVPHTREPCTVVCVFTEIAHWARGAGLEICIIVSGALLLTRAVATVAARMSANTTAAETAADPATARTRDALIQAVRYAATFTVAVVAALLVLSKFSVPLGSLVPVATVIGMGIGFGAQRVVADLLAGFFLFTERQFGVGDTIKVSAVGSDDGIVGVVEEVTLRVTRIRRFDGDIVMFPNSELRQVSNMSRDWARLVVEVPLHRDDDLDTAAARIDEIGARLATDDTWGPLILEPPRVTGVEELSADTLHLRVAGRTLPERHWSVARELRRRIVAGVTPVSPGDVEIVSEGERA